MCRRRDDTEERDDRRAGLLGDGPTPRYLPPTSYDEQEEEDYYYDDNEQNYDDDDTGAGNADENYTDRHSADVNQSVYCTLLVTHTTHTRTHFIHGMSRRRDESQRLLHL